MIKKTDKKERKKYFWKNITGDGKIPFVIIGFMIVIVSFLIILRVFVIANPSKMGDETVCHNSVITRATGILAQQVIPLNCKTSYICLSKDGSCEDMTNPEVIRVNTVEETYNTLAEKMANCWWMFGEGKVNYIGKDTLPQLYCSLCYQLAFDNSMTKIFPSGKISEGDFYNYLALTTAPDKEISYLDYLVGLKSSESIKSTLQNNNISFGEIDFGKIYYIAMGTSSEVSTLGWVGVGAAVGASLAVVILTAGTAAPIVLALGAAAEVGLSTAGGYFAGTLIQGESGKQYISPTIIEASSEDFNKLKCENIKTLA